MTSAQHGGSLRRGVSPLHSAATSIAKSFQLAVVAEHMSEAQAAAHAFDFAVVVTELNPDDVVF
ncbi:MAG: hypothetical protein ACK4LS_06320 [Microbacterium sp.]